MLEGRTDGWIVPGSLGPLDSFGSMAPPLPTTIGPPDFLGFIGSLVSLSFLNPLGSIGAFRSLVPLVPSDSSALLVSSAP